MTGTFLRLLTRLSEAGRDAVLSGHSAKPFFGPEFDSLLRRRVLVELAPLTDWETCTDCGCGMQSRPIRTAGAGFRAVCPLNARDDVVLSSDDIRSFTIDGQNLAQEIASVVGMRARPSEVTRGLWYLGETSARRALCLAFEPAVLAMAGLVPIIRRSTGPGPVTLLTSKSPPAVRVHLFDAGIHAMEILDFLNEPDRVARARMLEPSPERPKLLIVTGSATIEWRDYRVTLSHQLFPVFRRLVEKAQSRDPIASGPYLEDATGREAKDLVRELRDAMKAAGASQQEVMGLIVAVRGRGYRLNLAAAEIEVQD